MPSFYPSKSNNFFVPFQFQLYVPLFIKFREQHQFGNEEMVWHKNKTHMNIGYKMWINTKYSVGMRRSSIQYIWPWPNTAFYENLKKCLKSFHKMDWKSSTDFKGLFKMFWWVMYKWTCRLNFHLSPHALKTLRESALQNMLWVFLNSKNFAIFNKPNVASSISSSVSSLIQSMVARQQVSVWKGMQRIKINGDWFSAHPKERVTILELWKFYLINYWFNQQVYFYVPIIYQGPWGNQRVTWFFPWFFWETENNIFCNLVDSVQMHPSYGENGVGKKENVHLHTFSSLQSKTQAYCGWWTPEVVGLETTSSAVFSICWSCMSWISVSQLPG